MHQVCREQSLQEFVTDDDASDQEEEDTYVTPAKSSQSRKTKNSSQYLPPKDTKTYSTRSKKPPRTPASKLKPPRGATRGVAATKKTKTEDNELRTAVEDLKRAVAIF